MAATALTEQLVKYLTDAHSIEEQALAQLRSAPDVAGDPEIADIFRDHRAETERHELLIRQRLDAHGTEPSKVKDILMQIGGKGFVLFARAQPDSTGKLVAHAFSYEHLEAGAYELLVRVAERAGDEETAEVARDILDEEHGMADRLADVFGRATEVSLREGPDVPARRRLASYLGDAHAIEAQAIQLLERGPRIAGEAELARLFAEHLAETHEHQRLVGERLSALGGDPSGLKDAAMRAGALHWGAFFQAHPDTPGKLAAFAYAFEHLEIAGYEQLRRVAEHAADEETADIAERILGEERAAATKISGAFDAAVEASLEAQGVAR